MYPWRHKRLQIRSFLGSALLAAFSSILISAYWAPAQAMNIQKVVSPNGIEAWLVEDHTLPMLAMQFGFKGGASQDPDAKTGLAYFVSGMLDEGAGELTSQQFHEKLQDLAIEISFDASQDAMTGGLKTLSRNKDEAFRLLHLAISEPRMDQDAVERIREQIASIIKVESEDPERIALHAWYKSAFEGHPYGRPVKGNLQALATITVEDLKSYVNKIFARDSLKVAVVGDITADELGKALDTIFGSLPEKGQLQEIPEVKWQAEGKEQIIPMNMPQSVVTFGHAGPKRKDENFIAAYILNHIIGGGGFSSILMEQVREKRGLAYSVYTYLNPLDHAGIMLGGVATKNEAVNQSIDIIKEELTRIAQNGPTPEVLEDAKRYLTGSYALRFTSSMKIAQILLWIQIEDLGIDYIEKRNGQIEAVSYDDIKRVAAELIKPGNLIVTIVGQPKAAQPADAKPEKTTAPRG